MKENNIKPNNEKDNLENISKKESKEIIKLKSEYDKLNLQYEELQSKYNDLMRDSLLYKASHEAILDTKRAQDLLKRKEQDLANEQRYASKTFIKDLLEPFELFEQTLEIKNIPEAVKNWLKGFEMILNKFKNVLEQHGVKEINPAINSNLDEHLHEVIEEVEDQNVNSGKIAQVVRKGYRLHDRVIKYAQVKTNK